MGQSSVLIKLTPEQQALIRQVSSKDLSTLGIEPVESGAGWLYSPGGKTAWLLKHSDPKAYRAALRKKRPQIDPQKSKFHLKIGKSPIHGWGVFAEERIPTRRNVIEYTGELVNPVETYLRLKGSKRTYAFGLDEFWRIDGAVGGSGAEFINHSCDPNLRWARVDGRVFCQSLRAITPGEELSLDYHFPAKLEKLRCHCGSPKCRGTMNLAEEGRAKKR